MFSSTTIIEVGLLVLWHDYIIWKMKKQVYFRLLSLFVVILLTQEQFREAAVTCSSVFDRENSIWRSILSSTAVVNTPNFKFIGIITPYLALVETAAFPVLIEICDSQCLEIQMPNCDNLSIKSRFLVL